MATPLEQPYLDLVRRILDQGVRKDDRTGTGTLSVFGHQMRFPLRAVNTPPQQDHPGLKPSACTPPGAGAGGVYFPLLTTKKVHLRSIIHELLWFLQGETNIAYLRQNKVTIWDEWADERGDLGPVYGKQWRSWEARDGRTIDQIQDVLDQLKRNPDSRRLIVSAWNVGEIDRMALPPCHLLFQFYVAQGRLSCQLYQRSADVFLGVPFNIASYALLTMMMAQVSGLEPGDFVHTTGDAHLYLNHLDQAREQLGRTPRQAPVMKLNPKVTSLFDFAFDDFTLEAYDPHPAIKAPVAV